MYALTKSVTLSKIKKRSFTLLLFEVLLCLAAFSFSKAQSNDTTIFPVDPDLKPSEERNVCYTPECIHTASRVLSYMNASWEPCDNFYEFACGKFINTSLINGNDSIHQYDLVENDIHRRVIDYLRNETLPTLPRYARLIKTFYSSCIDDFSNKAKERNLNSTIELINKTSGWPLLKKDSWEDENFQWEKCGSQTEYTNILYKSFIDFGFYFVITENDYIPGWLIQQPKKLVTSRELYNNLLTFGQLFGVEKTDVENSLKQMREVINKLDGIYLPNNNENYSIKRMTVKELIQKYSNISWKEFFDTRVKTNEFADDDVIYVSHISYLDEFNKLIPTISKRDQANYLMWRAIYQNSASYFESLNTKNYPFEVCFTSTVENFNNAWHFLYAKNNFNNDSFPKDVEEMFHNIHEEYSTILKNNSWLDIETKLKALEKLESIIVEMPNQYLSYDKEIDEYYENLEIAPGDYLRSLSNITEFKKTYKPKADPIESPGNKRSWKLLHNATFVNAGYAVEENLIALIPAIFQGVFYDEKRPKYMNYGSMGSTFAHEISHAFDSDGRNYDKEGNFVNWWSPEANATFYRKVQCIINQHNHYRVEEDGVNINGERTNSEDTADYVGIKVAYSAYEKYMETHGLEPLLPNVNYTQRQLFWISYAQTECATMTIEKLKNKIQHSSYSIPKFRVIGSVSNSLKFARDFQCESNTKMNPKDKCTVW